MSYALGMKKYLIFLTSLFFISAMLEAKENTMSIYDYEVQTIAGEKISMSKYKGKTLLIVNVASECGFTPQYIGLEKLYQDYKDKGFVVLGFPSNQFREQEPKSNKEILFFCQGTYDVHFDMFAKIDVNGDNAIPLYKYLKNEKRGIFWTEAIKWNFTKFLVDAQGNVVERYGSATKPASITEDIEALLDASK